MRRERGYGRANCRECGGPIVWAQDDRGRRQDVDAQVSTEGFLVLWFDVNARTGKPVGVQRVSRVDAWRDAHGGEPYAGPLFEPHFALCPALDRFTVPTSKGKALGRGTSVIKLRLLAGGKARG